MGKFLSVAFVWLTNGFLNAAVIQSLWNWFVTPLGPISLTYWHAYGLGYFFSLIGIFCFVCLPKQISGAPTPLTFDYYPSETLLLAKSVGVSIIWGMAYLVHTFLM